VISGDTRPDGAIPQKCRGCNGPVPEVYTQVSFEEVSPPWKQYRLVYHTCSKELAEIATRAQPGWLVLYPRGKSRLRSGVDHECWPAGSEERLLQEVRQAYKGKVVAGHDLEIY